MNILELLKGSDDPQRDQLHFLRTQLAFWLLGATDGHAKNFSIFIHPGGGFRLTPLYDVISTQPLLDGGQLRRNRMRLSMAVGDNRHYRIHDVVPRHFVQTAQRAGFSGRFLRQAMDQLGAEAPEAIERVADALPDDFPGALWQSVNGGIRERLRRLAADAQ